MKTTLLVALSLLSFISFAQNKKAIDLYNKAKTAFYNRSFDDAEKMLKAAIKKDSSYTDAYYLLAHSLRYQNRLDEDFATFKTAAIRNGTHTPLAFLYWGLELHDFGKFAEAKQPADSLKLYVNTLQENDKEEAEKFIAKAEFCLNQFNNPQPFKFSNLGTAINSDKNDYRPAFTVDDKRILFTRNMGKPQRDKSEDFYGTIKIDGKWMEAQKLPEPINLPNINDGAHTISADGRSLFFTRCEDKNGYGGCDIYYSRKINNRWSAPQNIGKPINTEYRETQPSVSADGRTLYFVSNRPGGKGKNDIWVSYKNIYGNWSAPQNLGDTINTDGNEMAPFLHCDGRSFYFASDGHQGMGGTDVYLTKKNIHDRWGPAQNLGYPINTHENENDFCVNAAGTKAYFSSVRPEGNGMLDIYEFDLPEHLRPEKVIYLKGIITNKENGKPLRAIFELFNVKTCRMVIQSFSDEMTGEFLVPLPMGQNYALNVGAENFLFYSEYFELKVSEANAVENKYIELDPIKEGKRVVLRNVFFESDSYELLDESKSELDKLVQFMERNPRLRIELSGHTDNTGSASKNKSLSENRAKAVYHYLTENGIKEHRLSYKGYGAEQPIAPNNSESNKALNRRTEFKIISL